MDWRHRAACRPGSGIDPELFFPIPTDKPGIMAAKAVCARCPVTDQCFQCSMDERHEAGVWGGLSEEERRLLRLQNRPAHLLPPHGTERRYACGCRCADCKAARTAKSRRYRANGRPA